MAKEINVSYWLVYTDGDYKGMSHSDAHAAVQSAALESRAALASELLEGEYDMCNLPNDVLESVWDNEGYHDPFLNTATRTLERDQQTVSDQQTLSDSQVLSDPQLPSDPLPLSEQQTPSDQPILSEHVYGTFVVDEVYTFNVLNRLLKMAEDTDKQERIKQKQDRSDEEVRVKQEKERERVRMKQEKQCKAMRIKQANATRTIKLLKDEQQQTLLILKKIDPAAAADLKEDYSHANLKQIISERMVAQQGEDDVDVEDDMSLPDDLAVHIPQATYKQDAHLAALSDGQEYTIQLINRTTKRVSANVFVDGKKVNTAAYLIRRPNKHKENVREIRGYTESRDVIHDEKSTCVNHTVLKFVARKPSETISDGPSDLGTIEVVFYGVKHVPRRAEAHGARNAITQVPTHGTPDILVTAPGARLTTKADNYRNNGPSRPVGDKTKRLGRFVIKLFDIRSATFAQWLPAELREPRSPAPRSPVPSPAPLTAPSKEENKYGGDRLAQCGLEQAIEISQADEETKEEVADNEREETKEEEEEQEEEETTAGSRLLRRLRHVDWNRHLLDL
jgi:hypothetical protein